MTSSSDAIDGLDLAEGPRERRVVRNDGDRPLVVHAGALYLATLAPGETLTFAPKISGWRKAAS